MISTYGVRLCKFVTKFLNYILELRNLFGTKNVRSKIYKQQIYQLQNLNKDFLFIAKFIRNIIYR
jgi:hypothetical protein